MLNLKPNYKMIFKYIGKPHFLMTLRPHARKEGISYVLIEHLNKLLSLKNICLSNHLRYEEQLHNSG
jgi:hypothetical protein